MKLKNFLKIIIFILISGFLLITLSGCSKSEVKTSSKSDIDTSYDVSLASINKILERNEQYEHVNSIIRNLEFDSYSYTLNIFCSENNDRQLTAASNKRIAEVIRKYGNL